MRTIGKRVYAETSFKEFSRLHRSRPFVLVFYFHDNRLLNLEPGAAMSSGIPVKLLHEAEGHTVTCELKGGEL